MKKRSIIAVAGAIALTATVAFAAVTFDPETGLGFVGKGEVQEAFGWNNHALQANATDVTFYYEDTATYDLVCESVPPGTIQRRSFRRNIGVAGDIDFDARRRNQVNGFNLLGFDGDTVETGEGCPGGFPDEISRTLVSSSGGGLYVDHDDHDPVLIWSAEE
jgi:hypothetical protein